MKHIINQSSESPNHQFNTYTRIICVLATRSSPLDHINMSHYDPDPLLDLIHQHNQSNWICRILTPLNSHQNTSTTWTTCNFKHHSSNGICYYNEPNLRTYVLSPKPTRVQIYKYSIMTCSDFKLKLYPVQIITCVSIQI